MIGINCRKAGSLLALLLALLVAAGCGASSETEISGERLAPSMQEWAAQMLEEIDGVGEVQRQAVERVIETGTVEVSDYEQGLSGYRQCMTGRGYREIIFVDVGNGLRSEAPHEAGTDAQEAKYRDDLIACQDEHLSVIGGLYEMQVGNPALFSDHNEAIADCVKRAGLADASYSGAQFKREYEQYQQSMDSGNGMSWPFSFDRDTPESQTCMIANGWKSVDDTWPTEYLW